MNDAPRTAMLITLACSLLVAGSAQAQDSEMSEGPDYGRRGVYVGVAGTWASSAFEQEFKDLTGVPSDVGKFGFGSSGGVNARLGYRAFSWLAVEAQYEWVDALPIEFESVPIPGSEFRPHTVTANLKWILPTWRFQPYLLTGFGIGIWELETPLSSDAGVGFAARLGLGADMYITEHWALTVEGAGVLSTQEFEINTSNALDKFYYFSVIGGVTYRF